MNNSYDVVADAIREYWKTNYPRTVIAFFYQKYKHDNEWEWCEELAECHAFNDYETVIFQNDFCEGQTCVKDILIVPLDDIVEYYTENHPSKDESQISNKNTFAMLLHKETGCSLEDCRDAYDEAIIYLRSKSRMKG